MNTNFVIISNNCWGGQLYKWYNKPYNSPFVGLGIHADCYLKLISNFDLYMNQKLVFIKESKYNYREVNYPLALLNDVEIHFTHYKTMQEAKTKWERRTERMLKVSDKNKYYFKICDGWGADYAIFEKFHQLPFKNKISFTILKNKKLQYSNHIGILEHQIGDDRYGPDGKQLFKISSMYFNLSYWLLNSKVVRTIYKS